MRFPRSLLLGLTLASAGVCTSAHAAVLIEGDGRAVATARADGLANQLTEVEAPGRYFDGSRPADEPGSEASVPSRQFAVGVPEPGTWALILFGFAVVGAAVRRRKTTVPHFT